MSALGTIAPKLRKLIPLLSTENEGEALACLAAIRRTLAGAGLTVHDLADAIAPRLGPSQGLDGARSWGPPQWGRLADADRLRWLSSIQSMSEYGAWQYEFCEGIARRIIVGQLLTPKQSVSAQSVLADAWKKGLRP